MKLFSLPSGSIGNGFRAQWVTPPFDLAFQNSNQIGQLSYEVHVGPAIEYSVTATPALEYRAIVTPALDYTVTAR